VLGQWRHTDEHHYAFTASRGAVTVVKTHALLTPEIQQAVPDQWQSFITTSLKLASGGLQVSMHRPAKDFVEPALQAIDKHVDLLLRDDQGRGQCNGVVSTSCAND
jgi:hypothetical protein